MTGLIICAVLLCFSVQGTGLDLDEFKIKREAVYEFAKKPAIKQVGDRVIITFACKGQCDVAVAVEDEKGNIVRHLAYGVLGDNAPKPFKKGTLKQTIVWDGKDDQERYIDDKASHTIRVSLGLKAKYERTLFWSPKKRFRQGAARWGFNGTQASLPTPRICAAEDGVYVFEGRGFDHLKLFDHKGDYVRTVYPPPPDKLYKMKGLEWYTFPQDGKKLPLKRHVLQSSFLNSVPSKPL